MILNLGWITVTVIVCYATIEMIVPLLYLCFGKLSQLSLDSVHKNVTEHWMITIPPIEDVTYADEAYETSKLVNSAGRLHSLNSAGQTIINEYLN